MKKTFTILLTLFISLSFSNFTANAQETNAESVYIVITKRHFNVEATNKEEWQDRELEYFKKVTSQNEYVLHTEVLKHLFTEDNTEILFVTVYKDWADLEKSGDRITELENAAWPDEKERNAFFEKLDGYYTDVHSDEIYKSYSEIKNFKVKSIDPMIVYMKNSKLKLSGKEGKGFLEFNEKVTQRNPIIKGYYTFAHHWGSDSTDFIETYFYTSLCDLEKSNKEMDELVKVSWPNEKDRMAFLDDYNNYFTGKHQDFIYTNVPVLSK
ncbi:hypothetical protein [Flavobacterium agrisoli]|uniref:NIPSNAP protein n=1 Tax=Flavobacterium agrisoli TaxID=2793066 RepID=A0A934PN42_9FLAO|nr:hypothetical protein [Flavobacterium agrisoli]MBK0370552.1 hypothetical protein [Flavobacterium agrisoli]